MSKLKIFFTSRGRGGGDNLSELPRTGRGETDTGANLYQLATAADNHLPAHRFSFVQKAGQVACIKACKSRVRSNPVFSQNCRRFQFGVPQQISLPHENAAFSSNRTYRRSEP